MNSLSLKSYLAGLLLSLLLILSAYSLVVFSLASGLWLDIGLGCFSLGQTWVLLFLFLGLGQETKPHWNLWIFLFMSLVCAIVVVGSIWIMNHLNYNLMMSHDQ